MYEGSLFLYELPVSSNDGGVLTLISAPLGTTLSGGSLVWSSTVAGTVRTGNFIAESQPECGARETFVLELSVLPCPCQNNAVCHNPNTGETGEADCICQPGYHGKFYQDLTVCLTEMTRQVLCVS